MDKRWTNEKHLCFLRSVEASFVRTLLENCDGRVPAMDRILPDSCESTLDSKCTTKRNKRYRGDNTMAGISMDQKVIRRLRIHPYLSFQEDQVVPQMKRLKNDANEENGTFWTICWENDTDQNGYNAAQNNVNPNGNGNVVAAWAGNNGNVNKKNQARCYNYRGMGHLARNCTVRPRRRDAAYLQTPLLIAQKKEAGIQLQAEEFDLMAAAGDLDEIEKVNANCILMANLQQASIPDTQTDKAHVYDSDGSAEAKSREELYFLDTSKTASVSKSISMPIEEFSDDTSSSVARKFLNEVKSTIETLQRVVKQMTLDIHNLSHPMNFRSRLELFDIVIHFIELLSHHLLKVIPKVGESNALLKPVTSNSYLPLENQKLGKMITPEGDNACTSNPRKPTSKRFLNSTSFLGRVYFVECLGHNLLSVGLFCDSYLEVAFRRNTCFVRNLKGVDLLKENHTTNLYTINLYEMASASPICLMARATSTKSWLWHQRLSHLNFDTINDLAKNDLVTCLLKLNIIKNIFVPHAPPSPDYVPGPEYPKYVASSDDEILIEDQPLPAHVLPTALSPGYVANSDPEEDLEEDPEEDPANYLADGGDDDEEEEHLAPADSVVLPAIDLTIIPVSMTHLYRARIYVRPHTPPSPSTEALIAEARISVRPHTPPSPSTEALIAEYAFAPTPPSLLPSPLLPHLFICVTSTSGKVGGWNGRDQIYKVNRKTGNKTLRAIDILDGSYDNTACDTPRPNDVTDAAIDAISNSGDENGEEDAGSECTWTKKKVKRSDCLKARRGKYRVNEVFSTTVNDGYMQLSKSLRKDGPKLRIEFDELATGAFAIPIGLTAAEALESIQEIVEHSHRWHKEESDKKTSNNSLSTITDKLKNLNHDMNNLRENIHKINLKSNMKFRHEENRRIRGKISLEVGKEQFLFNANEGATPVTVSPVYAIKDSDVIDNIEGREDVEEFLIDDDLNKDLGSRYKEVEFEVSSTRFHVVASFCLGVTTLVTP
nr:integrase, catalytic region, zinc finger, CCHC-type, peptidase aspartic, catalytic [Tanacetum cinerariifolium]